MRRLAARTFNVAADKPVVSFTFDDVPDSALHEGAALLEKYGLRGTFYIAGGLAGRVETDRSLIDEQGIRTLAQRGHEVGCHSFAHRNTARLSLAQLQQDIEQNKAFLNRVLGAVQNGQGRRLNFAYPYNAVSYFARACLARNYRSCRAGENRINRGAVSLQMLYGMEIGGPQEQCLQLKQQIDALKAQPGWLIFFTHDVAANPTSYGCTPENFEELIRHTVDSGCTVLTVDEALDYYTQRQPA